MQLVHTISESGSGSAQIYNGAHIFSSLNRKMIEPVSKKGDAQLFHYKIEAQSADLTKTTIKTASNSYVTKQAVKAWYRVWRNKFREQGVSMKDLGPYGRVFKPMLTATHDDLGSAAEVGRGEWNFSDVVTTTGVASGGSSGVEATDLWDSYTLHLCGASVEDDQGTESVTWSQVGMINSWLASRRKPIGVDADAVPESLLSDANNPLLYARGGQISTDALLDEVRDLQADKPPYTEGDLDGLYVQAVLKSSATDTAVAMVSAPCGLMEITHDDEVDLIITLQGITDM